MLIPTIHHRRASRGFTMVELMIGIVVGMLVVAGVTAVYITTLQISNETIRSIKLNQELRAIMNIVTTDVRRAGYWSLATNNTGNPNPFTVRDTVTPANDTDITIHGGNCILYSYDATHGATTNFFGFKLEDSDILMLTSGGSPTSDNTCNIGTWEMLNDDSTIAISTLGFTTTGSQCLNVTADVRWEVETADTTPACDCIDTTICSGYVAPTAGDTLVEVRYITINLAGNHLAEPGTTVTFTEQIKLRNNRVAP